MNFTLTKKLSLITVGFAALVIAQTFGLQSVPDEKDDKPKNLKVLPKKSTDEEVHAIMRVYSKSLGVRCTFCHASTGEGKEIKFDFASDVKPEKNIARKMIKMTNSINKRYLDKIGDHKFEKIACVTCHNGNIKPIVTTDSLPKKQ